MSHNIEVTWSLVPIQSNRCEINSQLVYKDGSNQRNSNGDEIDDHQYDNETFYKCIMFPESSRKQEKTNGGVEVENEHCRWCHLGGINTGKDCFSEINASCKLQDTTGIYPGSNVLKKMNVNAFINSFVIGTNDGDLLIILHRAPHMKRNNSHGYHSQNYCDKSLNLHDAMTNSKQDCSEQAQERVAYCIPPLIMQYRLTQVQPLIFANNNEKNKTNVKIRVKRAFETTKTVLPIGFSQNLEIIPKFAFLPYPSSSIFISILPTISYNNMMRTCDSCNNKFGRDDNFLQNLPLLEIAYPKAPNAPIPTIVTSFDVHNVDSNNGANESSKIFSSVMTSDSDFSIIASCDSHGYIHLSTLFSTKKHHDGTFSPNFFEVKQMYPIASHLKRPINAHPGSKCCTIRFLPSYQFHNDEFCHFSGIIAVGNERIGKFIASAVETKVQVKLWKYECKSTNVSFPNMDISLRCIKVFTLPSNQDFSVMSLTGVITNFHINGVCLFAGTSLGSLYCWGNLNPTINPELEERPLYSDRVNKKDLDEQKIYDASRWELISVMENSTSPLTHLMSWNPKYNTNCCDNAHRTSFRATTMGFLISGDTNGVLRLYRPYLKELNDSPLHIVATFLLNGPCSSLFISNNMHPNLKSVPENKRFDNFIIAAAETGQVKVWSFTSLPESDISLTQKKTCTVTPIHHCSEDETSVIDTGGHFINKMDLTSLSEETPFYCSDKLDTYQTSQDKNIWKVHDNGDTNLIFSPPKSKTLSDSNVNDHFKKHHKKTYDKDYDSMNAFSMIGKEKGPHRHSSRFGLVQNEDEYKKETAKNIDTDSIQVHKAIDKRQRFKDFRDSFGPFYNCSESSAVSLAATKSEEDHDIKGSPLLFNGTREQSLNSIITDNKIDEFRSSIGSYDPPQLANKAKSGFKYDKVGHRRFKHKDNSKSIHIRELVSLDEGTINIIAPRRAKVSLSGIFMTRCAFFLKHSTPLLL